MPKSTNKPEMSSEEQWDKLLEKALANGNVNEDADLEASLNADVAEGLRRFENVDELQKEEVALNAFLAQKLKAQRKVNSRKEIHFNWSTWVLLLVILVLVMLGFYIIKEKGGL